MKNLKTHLLPLFLLLLLVSCGENQHNYVHYEVSQEEAVSEYISLFHHNATVELFGKKQTIDTINQRVYIEDAAGNKDTLHGISPKTNAFQNPE